MSEQKLLKKPKASCKDCTDRHVGCHSTCELYIQYRKDQDEYNKILYDLNTQKRETSKYIHQAIERSRRRH